MAEDFEIAVDFRDMTTIGGCGPGPQMPNLAWSCRQAAMVVGDDDADLKVARIIAVDAEER